MISFFRYPDPLRFAMLLLVLVIIRLPVFLYGYPMFIQELNWGIIGTKLAEGTVMYRDVWETLEPLSAGTYFLINRLFGESQTVLQVLSLILVFLQASLFNFIININNLFIDRNYIPALLYILFSSLFLDFYTLTPVMLGTTFLLLAVHCILALIRSGDHDEEIFYTGAFIAIAALFYYPLFVFIFLAILSFMLFTPTVVRKYFVLLTGFAFPFLMAGTYYFVRDGLDEFLTFMMHSISINTQILGSLKFISFMLIMPILLLLASFVVLSSASRYINYQYIAIRILGVWLVFAILALYFSPRFSSIQLFLLVPPLAFFGAHYFLLVKNKWIREVSFIAVVVTILSVNYNLLRQFDIGKTPVSYEKMIVGKPSISYEAKGNRILVFGNDRSFYKGNKLATPYLNWDLSAEHFANLNNYEAVSKVYENFSKDMPEVIIDLENLAPQLFEKIPQLKQAYEKFGEDGKVYVRKGL